MDTRNKRTLPPTDQIFFQHYINGIPLKKLDNHDYNNQTYMFLKGTSNFNEGSWAQKLLYNHEMDDGYAKKNVVSRYGRNELSA